MWTTNLTGSAPITGGRGYLIGTVGSVSGYTVPTAGSLQASFHFDRADMATNYGLRFLSDYSGGLYWGFETIGGTLNIQFKFIGGAEVDIPVTWSTDDYEVRLEWSGDGSAEAKTWEAGGTEPDWQLTASSWAPNSTSVYLTAD
jgi:hypothetical protein